MSMDVRDRLLTSTVDLMRRHGVAGTGLTTLLEHSKVARRSLYLHFPDGKAQLVDHATATAGRVNGEIIDRMSRTGDPVSVIQRFIGSWTNALHATNFSSGCPIVAATLGRSEAPAAADTAGEVFTDWQRRLSQHLQTAKLSPDNADQLATVTIAAVEGAIIMCQATQSDEPLHRVETALIKLYRHQIDTEE
jgi:TetR/AcrR family transcriptional regulator, lmrAB and yxaGH operons repressor